MSEMSAAEAEVVARFDAAEPAPESWRIGAVGCRDCGKPLSSPDELESGLCLLDLNGPVTARPVGDGDGQDGLREALAVIHAWDDDDNGTYVDLAARFTAWAEQRARERAAEELRAAADAYWRDVDFPLARYPEVRDWLRTRADDRTGQR